MVITKKRKKGIFFSMDALIALSIILIAILIAYPLLNTRTQDSYAQSDILIALSALQVKDINNTYMNNLIASGQINDLNKTVLEQIGEFYVINQTIARNLADSILADINTNENLGIWFGDKYISSKNTTPYNQGKDIIVDTQTISGIQEGGSVTGFSSRAFLTTSMQSEYFYFGGYIGEGNITARIDYQGNISSATMELALPVNFSAYVNGNFAGNFSGTNSFSIPQIYNLPTGNFSEGTNYIELKSNNLLLGLAGGFIKVTYEPDVTYTQPTKKYLPGIKGIINIYDGLYIPGNLNSMKVFLRMNNSVKTFMTIGNTTIYNDSTIGFQNTTINDSQLRTLLNYTDIINKTLPVRIGIENLSGLPGLGLSADVISAVDTSGSMGGQCSAGGFWCCLFSGDFCGSGGTCNSCGGTWIDPLADAQNATDIFIYELLNFLDSRVGVVGYAGDVKEYDRHNISKNETALDAVVYNWTAGGSTCICCGINDAVYDLTNNSNTSQFRSIVIMSDGEPNVQCSKQGTGNADKDAIKAACDAYDNHSIRTYTIGFGSSFNETLLIAMASCSQGNYYSTVNDLVTVYQEISSDLIETLFKQQQINYSSISPAELTPTSYIEFDYNKSTIPFGIVTSTEKSFDDEYGGRFSLPPNSSIIETRVTSYSSSKWAGTVKANNNSVYNLSIYGNDFLFLGDPYSINIPNHLIQTNNTVNITTLFTNGSTSTGSTADKIVYTIVQPNPSVYSSLSTSSTGCNWTIAFEDNTTINTKVPTTYNETDTCNYRPTGQNVTNNNDAMQTAVLDLFKLLDYDNDGRLDVIFTDQDLQITSSQITGIPFDWSTKIQARVWR